MLIEKFLVKKKATVKELQQLCGYFNFLNRAIFPGRAFTQWMYAKYAPFCDHKLSNSGEMHALKPVIKKHHHICLDEEFKLDCLVWKQFLDLKFEHVVSRPMIDLTVQPVLAVELGSTSDASANPELGFGCTFGNQWIHA